MRRLVLAVLGLGFAYGPIALAADIPPSGPPPPPPPEPYYRPVVWVPNWTGFYVGLHAGGAFGQKEWSLVGSLGSHDAAGWLAGGQLGFNYQAGIAVLGVEAQLSGAGLKGDHVLTGTVTVGETRIDFLGSVAVRLGLAFDRALLYGKAGGAWVHDKYLTRVAAGTTGEASETRWGWMVGAGVEYALSAGWSTKAEYNYMDFGSHQVTFSGVAGGTAALDIRQSVHVAKGGFNYRFGY